MMSSMGMKDRGRNSNISNETKVCLIKERVDTSAFVKYGKGAPDRNI